MYYVHTAMCDEEHPITGWYFIKNNNIKGPYHTKHEALEELQAEHVDYMREDRISDNTYFKYNEWD